LTGKLARKFHLVGGSLVSLIKREEPLLDIFDEDADLIVYLELLGIKEDKLRLRVANNKLIIDADKDYHKEISLPVVVNTNSFTKRSKNNILEVRLKKADYQTV
jgi:HSP20 family molecular chaperone IbpA